MTSPKVKGTSKPGAEIDGTEPSAITIEDTEVKEAQGPLATDNPRIARAQQRYDARTQERSREMQADFYTEEPFKADISKIIDESEDETSIYIPARKKAQRKACTWRTS